MRMKGHLTNITFVQIYAPTSDSSEKVIGKFYETLQGTLDSIPKKSVAVLMGDWNVKIGESKVETKNSGTFGLGTRNERGKGLRSFSITNNLIVGNSMFQNNPKRLWTWMSPGDDVRNQIYYISIGLMCKSALQNVRTLPGADHQLLLAKLNQRPRAIFPVRKRENNHGSHKLL